jgi:hypothetical protein
MSSVIKMTHLHSVRPQKTPPDPKTISRSIFLGGTERVLSYGGTSQSNEDGQALQPADSQQ